jgi:uncharacterized protein YceH (UPF0502 family)
MEMPMSENTSTDTSDEGFDLDPLEVRVLGVLIEKAFVTPDNYPLSVNAIVGGCNQLTGREPVMSLSEDDVQNTLDRLLERKLVSRRDQASARVAKYEHLVRLRHSLPPPEQAVLAALLLRPAQTPGEIRQRTERMYRFDDTGAVEAVLEHLADKYPPLVTALPRAPGTKETRYAQLMGGARAIESLLDAQTGAASSAPSARGRHAELEDEVRQLREELATLREEFERFRAAFE